MGRYAKTALMVLYALQLAIVFRDQLGHLYRNALETVRHEKTSHDERPRERVKEDRPDAGAGWRHALVRAVLLTAGRHDGPLLLAAAAVPAAVIHEDKHDHFHPQHDFHEKASHERQKQRRAMTRGPLLLNLYPLFRVLSCTPSAAAPRSRVPHRLAVLAAA